MTDRACSILLAHDDLVLRLSLRQLSEPRDDLAGDVIVVDPSAPALSELEAAAVRDLLSDPVIRAEVIKGLSGGNGQVRHARRPSKLL